MEVLVVFVCGEEPEDIWTAIYDAWMSRLGHKNVRIEPAGQNRTLFCEYRDVILSAEKSERVTVSIRSKLSEALYEQVYKAALSQDVLRGDKIYRFLIYAFAYGVRIMDQLQISDVYEIFQMNRNLGREYDHLLGFARFSQMKSGILLSRIHPKNDVTVLLATHFADRMPQENWIIYDCGRQKAAVHQAGKGWIVVRTDSEVWKERLGKETDEENFESLWKTFCSSITIEARYNPKCQQNMLPMRFRPYMTEFTS